MPLKQMFDSNLAEMNDHAVAFVGACGYEKRSTAIAPLLSPRLRFRRALAFIEHPELLSRKENERDCEATGIGLIPSSGGNTQAVNSLVHDALESLKETQSAIAFDISSMTRDWHGAIMRALIEESFSRSIEAFFVYVPGQFQPPSFNNSYNEIVRPIDGFASLASPSLPAALIMGLGYDPERALGLEELLDPKLTALMIPLAVSKDADPFYHEVVRNNSDIIGLVDTDWIVEYPLREPTACFGVLESLCSGLLQDYRVVLASLGPKLFGILCFLVAAKQPAISVWRVSSGMYGEPRDVLPSVDGIVVLRTLWGPEQK
jgi:hypothetical protein